MRFVIAAPCLAAALFSWSALAAAQVPADAAAAEVLFQEAQALYAAGDLARACPKFRASYAVDAALGTLLNLARCYEQQGRTASAWIAYVDLAPLAARAGQADRQQIALERSRALEPELMRLSVVVPPGATVDVALDGEPLAREVFGSAVPVDPGEHTVAARRNASAEPYWSARVTLSDAGKTVEVRVPAPPAVVVERPARAATPLVPPPLRAAPPDRDSDHTLAVAGGVSGGAGLVLLGVSAIFGVKAASEWSDAGCHAGLCPDAGAQRHAENAGGSADLATGFAVAGGLALATGAVLLLVGLSHHGAKQTTGFVLPRASVRF